MGETWTGGCYCGAVKVEADGPPARQGFCHCESCRAWSATPVTAYALWPAGNVRVTQGEDRLHAFQKSEKAAERVTCGTCGGSVMARIRGGSMVDLFPALLDGFPFEPQAHIFYGERMVDMKDGLPKFRDLPDAAGGSGETIAD